MQTIIETDTAEIQATAAYRNKGTLYDPPKPIERKRSKSNFYLK